MRKNRPGPMGPVMLVISVALLFGLSCGGDGVDRAAVDRHKKLAGELRDSKLYRGAIEEYREILSQQAIDLRTRANINYLIGRIYYENLADYKQAAAYYIRARSLDPDGSFVGEASRNLVAALEKMGHILDAKRQLNAAADIEPPPKLEGDVEVARVGGDPVWQSEIDEQIQAMPPETQKQFTSRNAKVEYVHNYVAVELLYRAAVREDYGSDPDIQKQQRLLHKKLLVDKYILDKVMPQITVDTSDVRNYYLARKVERYHDAPYDSVMAQVFLDYQTEKAEAAFSDYIAMLARAEKVEFFDQTVQ